MVPWSRGDPRLLCLCVQDLWRLPHGANGCERRAGFRGLFAQGHQFAVDRALHPRAHAGAGNHFQTDPVLQARRPAPVRCLWAAARAAGVTGCRWLPDECVAFPFNLVRIPASKDAAQVERMVASNRMLYDRIRGIGGVLYPVSAFPMSSEDWKDHFGMRWPLLHDAKRRYDPLGTL